VKVISKVRQEGSGAYRQEVGFTDRKWGLQTGSGAYRQEVGLTVTDMFYEKIFNQCIVVVQG